MDHVLTRLFVQSAREPDGGTLLHYLAAWGPTLSLSSSGLADFVKFVVTDLGIDPEATNERGETALLVAVKMGRTDLVELLLGPGVGASGSARDLTGRGVHHWSTIFSTGAGEFFFVPPLSSSSRGADTEPLERSMHHLLLTHDRTCRHINVPDAQGMTPLHLATLSGMVDVVRAYLSCGARVDSRCSWGRTALMEARCPATVALLLEAGADPAAADHQGSTAVHWAAFRNARDTLDVLCARGGDVVVNQRDGGGMAPLMEAARYNRRSAVQCLLSHGARADDGVRDAAGRTVLHHAARQEGNGAGEMFLDVLLAGGGALDATDVAGASPLDVATDEVLQAAAEYVIFDRAEALAALRDIASVLDGNPDVANVVMGHRFVMTHWWLAEESRMAPLAE